MQEPSAKIQLEKPKGFIRLLNGIERIGNRLPNPFVLFICLALLCIFISWLVHAFGVSVIHPGTGEEIFVKSLISTEGLAFILGSAIDNFVSFNPLGVVLALMLGIGLCQKIGLFEAAIKKTILGAPKAIITYAVLFIGILGNIASNGAYVVVPPLAAMVFLAVGRHPLAGMAAGIAGVGAGFTANILITDFDALISGISTDAAKTISSDIVVTPIDNWIFMSVSVFVLTITGAFVTERIIEPKLGAYKGNGQEEAISAVGPLETKALRNTVISALIYIGFVLICLFIPNSPLRNEDGGFIPSTFLDGITMFLLFFFLTIGITYGVSVKKIKNSGDVTNSMVEGIKDMSTFIVLAFAIAQFIAYIQWSNLAIWISVDGSELLKSINFTGFPVIILFVLLTAVLSLFITSGTALWSVLAPVFVPMLMLLDFHPAFIQVAYRVADSATNMITPLNPFVAIMLVFITKYDKKAGLGTHISLIFPYTIAFLLVWIVMICIFGLFGIPVGPGVDMYLK
ncbi:AbgT family transporter [Ureibacillus aquaedulcis]|uniref:AbgT family transporter n=1 Tax=Ureibacillus aquaedulcis TaxID=3058421 RepID=A0ABT8GNQ3_9BACL|nr:AbgT family transporter [Ureibacillus sp. BA0131]MDN4493055.1 AbgT family transporter [Ureibacillus sp. BA0131]